MKEIDQNIQLAQKLYREEHPENDLPDIDRYNACLQKAADINVRIDVLLDVMPWESDEPVVTVTEGICDMFQKDSGIGDRLRGYMDAYRNGSYTAKHLAENVMQDLAPDRIQYLR